MASRKLTGQELRKMGYPEGRVIGIAVRVMETHFKGKSRSHKLDLLSRVVENPAFYRQHEVLGVIAVNLMAKKEKPDSPGLSNQRIPYAVYGEEGIDPGAINQMEIAMKLPVTRAGALMADAHQGYGLPIGGVLATKNAVIPYGVGVDIGCRMCMSIYDLPAGFIDQNRENLKKSLIDHSRFGHAVFTDPFDDGVLGNKLFDEISILRSLKDRAAQQIGSSGGGNHFVEFGIVEVPDEANPLGLEARKYVALLTHSGSRGLGANIARHYTRLAMDRCKLPKVAKHLAWLDLDSEEGQEYWQAMNLAGDYASACHHHIHRRISGALGEDHMVMIENHHNFAWKEKDDEGNEIIVHRKGATPAGKDVLGIIPGSMTSPGFIVLGKGQSHSINSAAHGAGRVMSRRKAKELLSEREVRKHLKQSGIELIGSGLDEAPMVYKDIHQVMAHQQELVEVVGTFMPRVVRMCGDQRFAEAD